jgi:hypothetical protein
VAITKVAMPRQSGSTPRRSDYAPPGGMGMLSSRPTGVSGSLPPTRATSISSEYGPIDTTLDEMGYERIVRIIKAIHKR